MGSVITYRAQGHDLTYLDLEANTFDEATLQMEHGVYTVMRLYDSQRVFRLDAHFSRLRQSAALLNASIDVSDQWLRDTIRHVVEVSAITIPRLRLTVPFSAPDVALISLEPFTPPAALLYAEGVRVGLVNLERERPRAKNTRFIERRQVEVSRKPAGIYELVMVNGDGYLREGSGSNFYAVVEGVLYTAEQNVLEGIARRLLLEIAPDVLPVQMTPIHQDELPNVSEAFLTSASRGVMPIVKVGETVIGDGRPGEICHQLRTLYDAQLERELEIL